ncbi:MAG TPA: integrin alpha [Rubricoccaceae bacterium]|nr:integrin alpha [Rubricoccaceae bacterium]
MRRIAFVALALSVSAAMPSSAQPLSARALTSVNPAFWGQFGATVAPAGDVDGDGWPDLMVGAPHEIAQDGPNGRAYVYNANGGLLHALQSPWTDNGSSVYDDFGGAVAPAGDVDGDGYGDLLVGARYEDLPDLPLGDQGAAFVFSGLTGDTLYALASPYAERNSWFGAAVSGVGDLDRDGRDDFMVGAPFHAYGGHPNPGQVFVYTGASGVLLYELVSPHPEEYGMFGRAIAGVGDVDGDGIPDLLVGAPLESSGGRAYAFSGADGRLIHELVAPDGAWFGETITGLGDVSGDGTPDYLIGGRTTAAYVFNGASGQLHYTITLPAWPCCVFHRSVSGGDDVDGDGVPDILAGDPSGRRALVLSGTDGHWLYSVAYPGEEEESGFGASVALVGDLDDDRQSEVLVGAPLENVMVGPQAYAEAGRAYLVTVPVSTDAQLERELGPLRLNASPNPFAASTELAFEVPEPGPVRLAVYDLLGREVAVLADGPLAAGRHVAAWDAGRFPSGHYLARLEGPRGEVHVRRLTRLR